MVVFKTGFYFYSCGSDVDGSAVLCSAAGWPCFEPAFPVLHSGVLWADCCADPDYCEVSFHLNLLSCIGYFCGLWLLCVFLFLLAAVTYLMVWFFWFCSGGCLHHDGRRGFGVLLGYCMFMIIAFIK